MNQFYPGEEESLKRAVEYAIISGVRGDVAEFGCYFGHTAAILAKALWEMEKKYGQCDRAHGIAQRRLWAFDSFEGFPEATDPVDIASPHIKAGLWFAGQPAGGTAEGVGVQCANWIDGNRVWVVSGWYKDTLCKLPPGQKFAVIHIDCDYYESTKQVLDHLLGHGMLSDGCTILFDDWYCNRGSPDYGEQRAWADAWSTHRGASPIGYRYSDWGPYGTLGRRFIVHGGKQ